ncbi:MAG: protein jag [Oscillospiraceae bacterium]|nr:protein jag [Oscillospiraceae bacterium]
MRELIVEANSIEEAVAKGLAELGLERSDVTEEIIEEEKKGLFGKLKSLAKVKLIYSAAADSPKEKPAGNTTQEKEALEYLMAVTSKMGIEGLEFSFGGDEDGIISININGEQATQLIGHHGEIMDALQYLTSLATNSDDDNYKRIRINISDYREKRETQLEALALRLCRAVKKNGRSVTLEPMNPYERRIIHSIVSGFDGVYSRSAGEDPARYVVIAVDRFRQKGGRTPDRSDRSSSSSGSRTDRSRERSGASSYNKRDDYPKNNDYKPSSTSKSGGIYNFEKEFLKSGNKDKLFSKIDPQDEQE